MPSTETGTAEAEGTDFVAFTGLLVAGFRASETARPDRILADPLAAHLMGNSKQLHERLSHYNKELAAQEQAQQVSHVTMVTVIRARYLDEQLLATLQRLKGTCKGEASGDVWAQVVMLGAGLDTRPWRLQLPRGVSWFEVDKPDVLAAKQQRLQEAGASFSPPADGCQPAAYPLQAASWTAVAADLAWPDWVDCLKKARFAASLPTVWIAEGLMYYIPSPDAMALHKAIRQVSAPGSTLLVDYFSKEDLASLPERYPAFGKLFVSGVDIDDTASLLHGLGWHVLSCEEIARHAAQRYKVEAYAYDRKTDHHRIGRFALVVAEAA